MVNTYDKHGPECTSSRRRWTARHRMGVFAAATIAIAVAGLITSFVTASRSPASAQVQKKAEEAPIGECWMEEDGTIVVLLRRTADGIHVSMPPRRYPRSDPHYAEVLAHVGPIRPGEKKLVLPFPDRPRAQ